MNVYRKLVADLLVGDYLQVVSHVPNEDQRPECFRRVEKIEYIEAPVDQFFANRQYTFASGLSPQAGAVIVWVPRGQRAAHLPARRRDRLGRRARGAAGMGWRGWLVG
jgi:hypothetical protein